jgi:hypothetical protein
MKKNVAYKLLNLKKVIESQYNTRSLSNRADALPIQAKELSLQNVLASKLNLSPNYMGCFLKTGYVKNDEEHQIVSAF